MLRYRVTSAEGKRVEHILPVGLVMDFPKEKDAWKEVDKLGPAQTRLPQDGEQGPWREIVSMHRHDRLPSWIGAMPQKVVRSLASNHLKACSTQCCDDCATRQRREASHGCDSATATS